MRKILVVILVLVLVLAFSTPSLAGGDKVHGDKAVGPAYQDGNCPFGDEVDAPYGPAPNRPK